MMKNDIYAASTLFKGKCTLTSKDYKQILNLATENDLIYMDPPYQGTFVNGGFRYYEDIEFSVFVDSLKTLTVRNIPFILSYDGRTGNKTFGEFLPSHLELTRIEINAGRSSQATLLGRNHTTFESVYLSKALVKRLNYNIDVIFKDDAETQISLFEFEEKSGKSIVAYKFGDLNKIQKDKLSGRSVLSKEFKESLYKLHNGRCFICFGSFELRYLQIDHRVPYEISGDDAAIQKNPDGFMLLCGSCNRAKSWSCEHCINWKEEKDPAICKQCYWGSPEDYLHIALKTIRRLDILWEEHEIKSYEKIKALANREKTSLPDFVKRVLAKNTLHVD